MKNGPQSMNGLRSATLASSGNTPRRAGAGRSTPPHSNAWELARASSSGEDRLRPPAGVALADGLVVGGDLVHERLAALRRGQRGHGRDALRGVEDVDGGAAVVRGHLHGRVELRGRRAADEEREPQPCPLHLARHRDHLVQAGRDEAADADGVHAVLARRLQDPRRGHHHAESITS